MLYLFIYDVKSFFCDMISNVCNYFCILYTYENYCLLSTIVMLDQLTNVVYDANYTDVIPKG